MQINTQLKPEARLLPPWWSWAWPLLACAVLAVAGVTGTNGVVNTATAIILIVTVFAAVHHAEVVAHRVGEPLGTLVLAVAVTLIEVVLIVSTMIAHPIEKAGLPRDTVFAAVSAQQHRELAGLTSYRLSCLSLRFRLLEPIAALTTIAVHLPAHRALTDAQNFGDAFLARSALAQRINLAAILILYSPVLAHRQPLAISRGYPIVASLNYALAT